MALGSGIASPRYAHIEPILKTGQDQVPDRDDDDDDDGAGYYGGDER